MMIAVKTLPVKAKVNDMTTYSNDYGETLEIKKESVFTIDHSDIGLIYMLPYGENIYGYFTLEEVGIENPQTGEIQKYATYTPVILNEEEMEVIFAHMLSE